MSQGAHFGIKTWLRCNSGLPQALKRQAQGFVFVGAPAVSIFYLLRVGDQRLQNRGMGDALQQTTRAFIALPVPESIRNRLRQVQRKMEKEVPEQSVRFTPFEQLHLTLEFMGHVPGTQLDPIARALRELAARHKPFQLAAESLGAFSSLRNPRVIWASISGDREALKAFQLDVHQTVAPWGREPEDRPYRPHLTLGRVRPVAKRELARVSRALLNLKEPPFGEWLVTEFVLVQSRLSPHGAQHSVLASFALQGIQG